MWLRWVILLVAAYLIYRIISRLLATRESREPEVPKREDIMVLDPQCNTYIPKGEALEAKIGDEVFYFCSRECKREYVQRRISKGR
jgi:YHS domain-containing protein